MLINSVRKRQKPKMIDINELKLLNNNIFSQISENALKNLSKEGIEKLVQV